MISFTLILICIITFIYKYIFDRPHNFPPGPPKLPILGGYIFMLLLNRRHLHFAIDRICKFYKSTVVGIYIGKYPVVLINDLENVKKSLNHRDFDGRPDLLMTQMRHPEFKPTQGIFFREGESWSEQRRFTLRYLRDYGFGRRFDSFEHQCEMLIKDFMDIVKNGPKYEHEKNFAAQGKLLMPYAFGPTVGNCFITCLLNQPIDRKDMADLNKAAKNAFIFQRSIDGFGKMYSIIPSLSKYFAVQSDFKPGRESSLILFDIFKKLIDEQIKTYDPSHERHFIDMYLNKIRYAELNPEEKSYFSLEQLILTCVDFSFPPLSAVPSTISILFQQMCLDPEVQRKVQNEIDRVVGQGRLPTLDDRINLPYTEACIREIMRFETLVPSGVTHKAMVDTEFLGYNIPKETFIIPGLNAAAHDPTAWERPDEFWPERFLDSSGKLCLSKDISLPFGAGKRLCAGETFARNMTFLCVTSFMQAFTVQMPNGVKPLQFHENMTSGIRTPKDHWIEVIAR